MWWRRARWVAAAVFAGLLAPVAVGGVGIAGATGEIYAARGPGAPSAPVEEVAAPTHDPGKPTAVVVLGLPPSVAPVIAWLQRQRAHGDRLLVSVCVGAEVLAEAGLLGGRPATSHWLGLLGHRRNYPAVRWQDGVGYVDDGDLISTAGVLSGVDGALRIIERLVGPAAAAQAAREVAWPAYSPGGPAPIRRSRPAPADLVGLLSAGYRWDRPTMGVLLTAGVGETELASAFRPYTELSYLARPLAVTADGLSLPEGLAPVYLHRQPGFAFDGALADIANSRDVATARWVAKTLQYPATNPQLSGPAWPWALTLRPILIAATAIAAALGIRFLGRRRRGAFRGGDQTAPSAQPADTSSNVEPSFQLTRRRS